MNINSVNFSAYAASASITKDKDSVTVEASAVSVSASQTTIAGDSYVSIGQAAEDTGVIGYRPPKKLSADFIEDLEKQTYELMKSLAEKMINAQSRKCNCGASAGLDLSTLTQALGLGADAGMSDIQGLVDGLRLDLDVSGMSYEELAESLGIGTTPETAAAAISEDGMWGVDAVATRLMDFALSLSKGDSAMAAELREAVTRGFEAVGLVDSLPQVCQDTYAETMARFDYWEEHGTMEGYGEEEKAEEDAVAVSGGVIAEESVSVEISRITVERE